MDLPCGIPLHVAPVVRQTFVEKNRLFLSFRFLLFLLFHEAHHFTRRHVIQTNKHDTCALEDKIPLFLIPERLHKGFDLRIEDFRFFSPERDLQRLTAFELNRQLLHELRRHH